MPTSLRIGSRQIGADAPCFLIAEAGVNHNGDLAMAKRLAVEAARAGADCVKFQTFSASRLATATTPKARYQLRTTDRDESQLDMLRKLELRAEDHEPLLRACAREGIPFLSSPYNIEDVDLLESLDVAAYKIPSALIVEPDLLRHVAATGRPVILSAGLATLAEVGDAVAAVRSQGNEHVVVLQCTTDYPARSADANLRAMQTIGSTFDVLVGYSDHTETATTAVAAVALGAVIVEKHFTLDRSLPGPDQATSCNPEEFASLVRSIREVEAALGDGCKRPSEAERANLVNMRRGLVANQSIAPGTILEASMLSPKRPATGILPRELDRVVGRATRVAIEIDQPLDWSMLEDRGESA